MAETADLSQLPRACRSVAEAAAAKDLSIDIRIMAESTRTAEEAAAACETTVAQIVKSLVFRGKDSGRPILLLVSGTNRVKEKLVARTVGEKIVRPDAAYVREATGFAIGGIPPFGHAQPLATFIDEDLLTHDVVFAAAGTPNAIFSVAPAALRHACQAQLIKVHE
jgi:prolyl-tRNA editing enzyme YbaK/EbsC (Cys-tRNA(Pro) deacylase)